MSNEQPFTVQVGENDTVRQALITPVGWWSETITVNQFSRFKGDQRGFFDPPTIHWGSGGRDGKVDDRTATLNFQAALTEAVRIYDEWSS